MNELMDRLARANPTQTDEPLTAEEQREADALLARILADSPTVTAPKRAPTLRRVAPAAGLLAVLALAAVIVIDIVDSEERSSGIVERAVAAVSQENVIYAITERATITSKALEPGVDIIPDERTFARSWYWGEGERSRMLRYRVLPSGSPGRLLGEVVSTPERIVWFDAKGNRELAANWDEWDEDPREGPPTDSDYPGFDPSSNPGAQLREHVEQDRLRVAGRTTVRGRTAYRLVSSPIPDPDSRSDHMSGHLSGGRPDLPAARGSPAKRDRQQRRSGWRTRATQRQDRVPPLRSAPRHRREQAPAPEGRRPPAVTKP